MKKTLLSSLSFLPLCASLCFASPSLTTEKISHYVDDHQQDAIALLKKVVNINSQTENLQGVIAVGSIFEKELQALGFKTYWEKMPAKMHRAGNLFAVREGNQGTKLLLIGHLDTVFPATATQQFEILPNNIARGIGITDMKGGDVVIIQALKALDEQHLLNNKTIMVALIGDEENAGKPVTESRHHLQQLALKSDVVLDFESGPPSLGRRGVTLWRMMTTGTQQHSSLIFQPSIGNGAIYNISNILSKFYYRFHKIDNITINPSLIVGGTNIDLNDFRTAGEAEAKFNVIAKNAIAVGDLRYSSSAQRDSTKEAMISLMKTVDPHASINFNNIIPAMPATHENKLIFDKLYRINHDLKLSRLTLLPIHLRGGGDISYIASSIQAGLVGLGPIGKDEHSQQETIDLVSLNDASKRAAILIYQLTNE